MQDLNDPNRDPIQVHENNSGPIRKDIILPNGSVISGSLHYNYIAYRDAERDAAFYGYGGTEEEAIADYLRQICEEACSKCPSDSNGCTDATECILTLVNFSILLKREMDYREADTTHGEWRALNKPE